MKDSTFGGLMFLVILAVVILIAVLMNKSHASPMDYSYYDRLDSLARVAQQDTAKWAEFLSAVRMRATLVATHALLLSMATALKRDNHLSFFSFKVIFPLN